jgi:hypothetical protein
MRVLFLAVLTCACRPKPAPATPVAPDAAAARKTCVAGPPTFDIPEAPEGDAEDLRRFVAESIEDQAATLAACSTAAGNPAGAIEIQLGVHEDPVEHYDDWFTRTTRNDTGSDSLARCIAAPFQAIVDETATLGGHFYYTATIAIACGPAPLPVAAPTPPSGSTTCKVVGVPAFDASGALPSVEKNVKARVTASAADITACGAGVGASAGRVGLTFGLGYDEEVYPFYRISENTTGNRALGTCLRGVAKAIAESTYRFDIPDGEGDGDVGEGNYEATVTLSCTATK